LLIDGGVVCSGVGAIVVVIVVTLYCYSLFVGVVLIWWCYCCSLGVVLIHFMLLRYVGGDCYVVVLRYTVFVIVVSFALFNFYFLHC
jgi:hypothetical protein